MDYLSKVALSGKVRRDNIIKISLVGSVCLLGLILCIYSLATSSFLFALWYALAFVLGLSYVIISINACFPTFLATDGEKVVLSVWENGIMPYTLPEKPNFISDFIPEKIKTIEVAMEDIGMVSVGSLRLIKKSIPEEDMPEIFKRLGGNKHFDTVLKRMDFLFIKTKDDKICFMSVTDFDIPELSRFLDVIEKSCQGVQVTTNIPKLVKMRNARVN